MLTRGIKKSHEYEQLNIFISFNRGCADGGRLGHGSLTATKKSPEIVTSLLNHKIGQVSCGFNHTVR